MGHYNERYRVSKTYRPKDQYELPRPRKHTLTH